VHDQFDAGAQPLAVCAACAGSGARVESEPLLVDGAFAALSAGKRDEHDALVTQAALALAPSVDRLVLAQASLAHLADSLEKQTGKPVFASPEWMVRDVVARVAASA
jgi:hypothetical protein